MHLLQLGINNCSVRGFVSSEKVAESIVGFFHSAEHGDRRYVSSRMITGASEDIDKAGCRVQIAGVQAECRQQKNARHCILSPPDRFGGNHALAGNTKQMGGAPVVAETLSEVGARRRSARARSLRTSEVASALPREAATWQVRGSQEDPARYPKIPGDRCLSLHF